MPSSTDTWLLVALQKVPLASASIEALSKVTLSEMLPQLRYSTMLEVRLADTVLHESKYRSAHHDTYYCTCPTTFSMRHF